jgi:hypothetical protein
VRAKRRWSGISGDCDNELWVIGILSLQAIPRFQNPTIHLSEGRRGIPGEVEVVTSPAPVHNVADYLKSSVYYSNLRVSTTTRMPLGETHLLAAVYGETASVGHLGGE